MGDVLTGMLGALLAQRYSGESALVLGVHLHGAAADALVSAGTGPVGLTAGELIDAARRLWNGWLGPAALSPGPSAGTRPSPRSRPASAAAASPSSSAPMPPEDRVAEERRLLLRVRPREICRSERDSPSVVHGNSSRWRRKRRQNGNEAFSASETARIRGAKRAPRCARFLQMPARDRVAQREQLRGALGRHGAEVFGLAHQRDRRTAQLRRGRPAPGSAGAGRRGRARTTARSRRARRRGGTQRRDPRSRFQTLTTVPQPAAAMNERARATARRATSPARTGPSCSTSRQGRMVPWTTCEMTAAAQSPLVICSKRSGRRLRRAAASPRVARNP